MQRYTSTVLAGLLAVLLSNTVHASLIGLSFDAYYGFPDIDTAYVAGIATPAQFTVVDPGVETVFDVEGVTTITVDFGDNYVSLLFTTILGNPSWNIVPFNGVVFDEVGPGAIDFTSAAIDGSTTIAGFDASRVLLQSDRLALNWAGLSYMDGAVVRVNFSDGNQVPAPGTLLLVVTMLGLLLQSARRRR